MLTSLSSPDVYRALLDSMTEGVSLADESGRIVYTNPAEDELFGYARGELLGQHVSLQNAYPESENQQRVSEVIAHLKAHGAWTGEWINRRKDGSTFVTASRISAVVIGGAQYWLCVQRDVTAEREAETRLRDKEERLRLAAAAAAIGTWDIDLLSGRGEWDDLALTIAGVGKGDHQANAWAALVHPEDRDRVLAAFRASLAAEGPDFEVDFRVANPAADGSTRWLAASGAVVRDPASREPMRAMGIMRDISAERGATEALRESEARFRAIVDAVPSLVWFARPDGFVEYFNDRWYSYTGQTPEQAIGDGWAAVLHPDDAERTARAWEEARAAESNYEIECRYRAADGSYRWYVARAEPMRDADGKVVRWFGTSTDIHEQRQAIERLELALDSGAIQGTWVWDVPADCVTADDRFADTFGIDPEACRRGFPIELAVASIHEDDRAMVSAAIDAALASGGGYRVEYRVRNAAGEYRWIEASGRVELAGDGAPLRFPGVAVDIEGRRAIERERDRATALLEAFFKTLPGAAYAKDLEGRLLLANPGFELAIGQPASNVIGKTDLDVMREQEQAQAFMANDRMVLESGRTHQLEEDLVLPDGRRSSWLSIKTPLRGADGEVSGIVGISLDITERRQAEEQMRLLAREVDHRAKNLLGVVQSVVQLTRADDVGSFKSAVGGRIQSLARAHSLLAESRWVGVGIDKLVREELAPFARGERDRVEISGPALRLRPAASQALALVIHELATNAAKYGSLSSENGTLAVSWGFYGDGDADKLEFAWRERGGPPVAAPASRGFGAVLLQTSVERQLGGALDLDWAADGLSCRFSVSADQLAEELDDEDSPPAAPAIQASERSLEGLQVLLVEDEALIGLRIESLLTSMGCKVLGPAASVRAALALVEQSPPDLAVLDVNLGGETSEPVALALRKRGIPFVFATGYAAPVGSSTVMTSAPVLNKPIAKADLRTTLQQLR